MMRRTGAGRRSNLMAAILLVGLAATLPGRAARAEISAVNGGIRFTHVNADAGSVSWVGEFNGWNTTANPMTKDGDTWSVVIPLPPGEHAYKLFIDGVWTADPDNPVTKGEFGNSIVVVGADGQVVTQAATSNTALNPKILIGGRFIGLFVASEDNSEGDRIELRRPDFDLDLDFKVRMSDVLDARMLANIQSENEDVQFFRSRLNFDRGSLHLHTDRIDLFAFDNDRLGTWEDPLHLVGDVGIYHHDYGYNQQGMQARKTIAGAEVKVLYSDNFRPGGTSRPGLVDLDFADLVDQLGAQRLAGVYRFNDTDNDKDVLAGRVSRPFGKSWKLGASARLDRGQNPGSAAVGEVEGGFDSLSTGTGSLVAAEGPSIESWLAYGGDAEYSRGGWKLRAEYLRGKNELDFVPGSTAAIARGPFTDGMPASLDVLESAPSFTIAEDDRAFLDWSGRAAGFNARLGWAFHGTDVTPLGNDSTLFLSNALRTWTVGLDRSFDLKGGRKALARLGLEIFDFSYDRKTPWKNQFWFDRHNFWLEAGDHVVSFDKMALLGGHDVISWQPSFSIDVLTDPALDFRYAGTFNGVSFDTRPKYIETLLQAHLKLSPKTRLNSDTRWVKYDDPVLQLDDGYVATFLELAYDFTPGITFGLSWGVDPYVIDGPVNEYAYIGRDAFLFSRDATGARAQENFFSLADVIPAAEKALEDERRIQLEAIVRF